MCDSKEARDNLHNIVNTYDEIIPTKTPHDLCPSITVVGLPKEYNKAEISDMLVKQKVFYNEQHQ